MYVVAIVAVVWPGSARAHADPRRGRRRAATTRGSAGASGSLIAHGHVVPVPRRRRDPSVRARPPPARRLSPVVRLGSLQPGRRARPRVQPHRSSTGAILNVLAARALARRLTTSRLVHTIAAVAFLTAPPIALNVQLGLLPLFWAFTAAAAGRRCARCRLGHARRAAPPARGAARGRVSLQRLLPRVRRPRVRIDRRYRGAARSASGASSRSAAAARADRGRRAPAVHRAAHPVRPQRVGAGHRHRAARRQQLLLRRRALDRRAADAFDVPAPAADVRRAEHRAAARPALRDRGDDLSRVAAARGLRRVPGDARDGAAFRSRSRPRCCSCSGSGRR